MQAQYQQVKSFIPEEKTNNLNTENETCIFKMLEEE